MVPPNNPDAACMDQIERTERKNPSRITPPSAGRADFDFFVRFESTASCTFARRHAGASQLRLLLPGLLSRSDRRVLALLLVARVDCAVLCCTVLCLRCLLRYGGGSRYAARTCSYILVRRTYQKMSRKKQTDGRITLF